MEEALARCFLYQWFARAWEYPSPEVWQSLLTPQVLDNLKLAVDVLAPGANRSFRLTVHAWLEEVLKASAYTSHHDAYLDAVGHAARGSCPINEIEYGDLRADPLFQPHRLADLGAFYRAFGLELGADADERQDHLSVELEFMAVLTAQQAQAVGNPGRDEGLKVGLDAQRMFLREHLGRWVPTFSRRLHRAVGDGPLGLLALFLVAFIQEEGERLAVPLGGEDLVLRAADPGAALCDQCGLNQALPGESARSDSPD